MTSSNSSIHALICIVAASISRRPRINGVPPRAGLVRIPRPGPLFSHGVPITRVAPGCPQSVADLCRGETWKEKPPAAPNVKPTLLEQDVRQKIKDGYGLRTAPKRLPHLGSISGLYFGSQPETSLLITWTYWQCARCWLFLVSSIKRRSSLTNVTKRTIHPEGRLRRPCGNQRLLLKRYVRGNRMTRGGARLRRPGVGVEYLDMFPGDACVVLQRSSWP